MKLVLLTPTGNQKLRIAMLKANLRMKKENIKRNKKRSNSCRPQQKSNEKLQEVADYKLGDRLKEGTKIFILFSIQQVQQM